MTQAQGHPDALPGPSSASLFMEDAAQLGEEEARLVGGGAVLPAGLAGLVAPCGWKEELNEVLKAIRKLQSHGHLDETVRLAPENTWWISKEKPSELHVP